MIKTIIRHIFSEKNYNSLDLLGKANYNNVLLVDANWIFKFSYISLTIFLIYKLVETNLQIRRYYNAFEYGSRRRRVFNQKN